MYGYYPHLFPSKFVMGMVGSNSLQLRREVLLIMHFYKLLNNYVDNPSVLRLATFYVPDSYARVRTHVLFHLPKARTNILQRSPVIHALTLINTALSAAPSLDIFCCTIDHFRNAIVECLDDSRSVMD